MSPTGRRVIAVLAAIAVAGIAFLGGIACVITGGAQKSDEINTYTGLWGTKLQLLGLAIFVVGAILTALTYRLLARNIPPRPTHVYFQPPSH
ncbi:hypothetical protein AB0L70_33480 [Kribbella sp. NPDC051952]|uniref:hypothetical protein n=1 Tax=Kribbella sp. NPDC051952 TaxID=3154851 RepID=UPI00343BAED2